MDRAYRGRLSLNGGRDSVSPAKQDFTAGDRLHHSQLSRWTRRAVPTMSGARPRSAGSKAQVHLRSRNRSSAVHPVPAPGDRLSLSPGSRAARRSRALCRSFAEICGTHLVHPPAVCSQSRILTRGDDVSAPRTDLPGSMRLVRLRIEVLNLPILAVKLPYLAFRRILAILQQAAFGPLPKTLGLLLNALFLAELGRLRHRGPWYVRDRRAFPWHPSLTLPPATLRANAGGPASDRQTTARLCGRRPRPLRPGFRSARPISPRSAPLMVFSDRGQPVVWTGITGTAAPGPPRMRRSPAGLGRGPPAWQGACSRRS
jgi:hypothetical protein